MNHWPYIFLFVLCMGLAVPAFGQQATSEQRAQELSQRAVSAFKAGDFEQAAQYFLDAHALAADPVLLYNAAYALGRAGDLKQASDVARRAASTGLEGNLTVTRNDARLRGWGVATSAADRAAAVSNSADAPKTVQGPTASPTGDSGSSLLTPVGAGATAGGAGLLTAAFIVNSTLDSKIARVEEARSERDRQRYETALDDLEQQQRLGRIFVYAGSALAAGGLLALTWSYLDRSPDRREALAPAVSADTEGVRIEFFGSF